MIFYCIFNVFSKDNLLLASPFKTLYNDFNECTGFARSAFYFSGNDLPFVSLIPEPPEDVCVGLCVLGDLRIAATRFWTVLFDRISSRETGEELVGL